MRWKGINYDTGVVSIGDRLSRASLDPLQVRREMESHRARSELQRGAHQRTAIRRASRWPPSTRLRKG